MFDFFGDMLSSVRRSYTYFRFVDLFASSVLINWQVVLFLLLFSERIPI